MRTTKKTNKPGFETPQSFLTTTPQQIETSLAIIDVKIQTAPRDYITAKVLPAATAGP